MNLLDYLRDISSILNSETIDFAIIGGLALGAHGVVRFTNAIDLIIDGESRLRLKQALTRKGFAIFSETPEFIQFSGLVAIDVLLANRPISLAMLRDAKISSELACKVIGAEQIIGLKIQAYCNDQKRELRDKADIGALIEANKTLDWSLIQSYAELFGQWETIKSIRQIHGR